jgi:hypothetical protein
LIDRLAGDAGAALFAVTSELGPGFFILIAYTICGGLVHYLFSNTVMMTEHYAPDPPHHKVDLVWTILFGHALTEVPTVEHAPTMLDAKRSAEMPNEPTHEHYFAEEDVI